MQSTTAHCTPSTHKASPSLRCLIADAVRKEVVVVVVDVDVEAYILPLPLIASFELCNIISTLIVRA